MIFQGLCGFFIVIVEIYFGNIFPKNEKVYLYGIINILKKYKYNQLCKCEKYQNN